MLRVVPHISCGPLGLDLLVFFWRCTECCQRFLCPWDSLDAEAKSALPGALKECLEKEGASLTGAERE